MKKFLKSVECRLIEDWRQAWRKLSVILSAVTLTLIQFQDQIPFAQQYLPADWVKYAVAAILVARLIRQKTVVTDA